MKKINNNNNNNNNKTENNIIQDVRNFFRLKKEINDAATKNIRNLFRLKKENEAIKDRVIRDIRDLFKYEEEENCYKSERVGNIWSNNYIEYQSNGDRNKTISVEKYLNKSRPYLKGIINYPKKSHWWKIQLTIVINFIYPKDNDEERVMHSNSYNIEIGIDDKGYKVIEEPFQSPLLRH